MMKGNKSHQEATQGNIALANTINLNNNDFH